MEEIKFKYYFKNWETDKIHSVIFSLDDIQKGNVMSHLFDNPYCFIFSRCQYTGLKDKNGQEIYEGDIIKYSRYGSYIQQSHPDINPEIDEVIIVKCSGVVEFRDSAFRVDGVVIDELGLEDNLDEIKDFVFGCHRKELLAEDEMVADFNGTEINEDILGIVIVSNKYENPELLEEK